MSEVKLSDPTTILQVKNLQVSFMNHGQEFKAVDDISFTLHKGESIGIVGESGSGKSVTALSIMNLLKATAALHNAGNIYFNSREFGNVDILDLSENTLRSIRGNEIAMVFQEPMSSLNPVYTCGNQVKDALQAHMSLSGEGAKIKTLELFEEVKLPRPEKIYNSYPHEILPCNLHPGR